jgi:hypothetical protein
MQEHGSPLVYPLYWAPLVDRILVDCNQFVPGGQSGYRLKQAPRAPVSRTSCSLRSDIPKNAQSLTHFTCRDNRGPVTCQAP